MDELLALPELLTRGVGYGSEVTPFIASANVI